jgi:hypothetical protein
MKTSETISKIAAALAKAQGAMRAAVKDAVNPHFKSRYADLAGVWDACREPLSVNGLAVVQAPGEVGDRTICITTLLTHESGEWIQSTFVIPVTKPDAQGVGSSITYARRYALAAMVGIVQDDDDGNAASAAARMPAARGRKPDADTPAEYRDSVVEIDLDAACAEIAQCTSLEELKSTYERAYRSTTDKSAIARLMAAKDAVKERLAKATPKPLLAKVTEPSLSAAPL